MLLTIFLKMRLKKKCIGYTHTPIDFVYDIKMLNRVILVVGS
jgi:hypothetical protein